MKKIATKEEIEKEIDIIVEGIKQYVKKAHSEGVIIGISGGIDSSVVATLCTKALGDFWVKGVYLPCQTDMYTPYSKEEIDDQEDAFDLAEWLSIEMSKVDITTPFTVMRNMINFEQGTSTGRHGEISLNACANLKARLRMATLYAMKEDLNYLCAGTGNKTELTLGYLTKYGDGGVDFEPIGEFYKTEVRIMADVLGIKDAIPNIYNKAPSARLTPGQTDEDDLGATYEEIDNILLSFENFEKHECKEIRKKLMGRIVRNKHKNKKIPTIFREPHKAPDGYILRF